jgi:hypothetical protein
LSDNQLVIELPPPGMLIRDLAITAINMMGELGGVKISQVGDEVIISHNNLGVALGSFSREVNLIYEVKSHRVNWPYLHYNDKETLEEVIPQAQLSSIETYGDVSIYYVNKLPELLGRGGRLSVELSRDSIMLGQGEISMFQLFKVELYEGGLSFNQPYRRKLSVRFDEAWASLLLSGFILSYMGMRSDDGVVISTIPEVTLEPCSRDSWLAVNLASTLYDVPTNPTIPYILYMYVTLILLEEPSSRRSMLSNAPKYLEFFDRIFSRECKGRWDRGVALRVHRIAIAGRTFTEISREDLVVGAGVAMLADLCTIEGCECLQQLRGVIEKSLGAREPKILNAVTMLYEALIGSKNPAEASYYLARAIKDQEEREGRTLINRYCFGKLLEILTGINISYMARQ